MTTRPLLAFAAALLMAGSAAAQPTPATPGPAGAEAMVASAYTAALRGDWSTVGRLLPPEALAAIDSTSRAFAGLIRNPGAVLGDRATAPMTEAERRGAAARRARLEAWADTSSLMRGTPAETFGHVVSALSRTGDLLMPVPSGVVYQPSGSTVITETLVHVSGLIDAEALGAGTLAVGTGARWTGERWTLAADPADPNANPNETDPLEDAVRLVETDRWAWYVGDVVRRESGVGP